MFAFLHWYTIEKSAKIELENCVFPPFFPRSAHRRL